KSFDIGEGRSMLLDTKAMVHIMVRHVPEFWDGSTATAQSFFDRGTTAADITQYVGSVVRQNRQDLLAAVKAGAWKQVVGTVGDQDFTLGTKFGGRIGQFYPH
ncbi:hypothetical protein LN042_16410, partial [Kitasatospora sp. RB6PN24]|uniref:hypothetical protein n=1 Tax=Kitasatospora humi TaxID=2893891 RepID=UPI001E3B8C9F